jgi:hypothetical protein
MDGTLLQCQELDLWAVKEHGCNPPSATFGHLLSCIVVLLTSEMKFTKSDT